MQHPITMTLDAKYNLRRPSFFTNVIRNMLAIMPITAIITVTSFASICMPQALITKIMYGCKTVVIQNSKKKYSKKTRKTGFSDRLRFSSWILSQNVGCGCSHLIDCFAHGGHDWDSVQQLCNSWNSFWIVCGVVHPRSHCRDFSAFFV